MAKKKTDEVLAVKENIGPVMYLGPVVPKKGLKTNQLFKDGIPEAFNVEPFKRLFAEPLKISEVKKAIQSKGTAANLAYKEILEME